MVAVRRKNPKASLKLLAIVLATLVVALLISAAVLFPRNFDALVIGLREGGTLAHRFVLAFFAWLTR